MSSIIPASRYIKTFPNKLPNYISSLLTYVSDHAEGVKTLKGKKRNENGADKEDAAFQEKQNVLPKLLKCDVKMCG